MDPEDVKEFGWALDGEERTHREVTREARELLERMDGDPANVLGDFEIPDSDRKILARPEIAALMKTSMREAFVNGVWGWVDDDLAATKPWGFEPSTISVTTAIWWGADDVLVPPLHGQWLAATVPNALTRIDESGGHQADPDTHIEMAYGWLLDGTAWPD
jgi:pimeloyl-ACP methyl ester carboxylesterase